MPWSLTLVTAPPFLQSTASAIGHRAQTAAEAPVHGHSAATGRRPRREAANKASGAELLVRQVQEGVEEMEDGRISPFRRSTDTQPASFGGGSLYCGGVRWGRPVSDPMGNGRQILTPVPNPTDERPNWAL